MPPADHTMQCMEVWGGNGASDNGVTMPGLDVWVFSRPHGDSPLGGDLHYVSSCGTGRISRLMVADVAGHGQKVAALAGNLRTLMRRYVNFVDQGRFVQAINGEFAKLSDGGRFATAIVATFWAPTTHLVVNNAGHPPPIAFSGRRRAWSMLRNEPTDKGPTPDNNLPLGIDEAEQYKPFALRLRAGDIVVIYSDSLIESRNPAGDFLGDDGLLRLAESLDSTDPSTLAHRLYQAVLNFTGGSPPDDDVTIMVLRPNGQSTEFGFLKKITGTLMIGASAVKRLFNRRTAVPWPEPSYENIIGSIIPGASKRRGKDAQEL